MMEGQASRSHRLRASDGEALAAAASSAASDASADLISSFAANDDCDVDAEWNCRCNAGDASAVEPS